MKKHKSLILSVLLCTLIAAPIALTTGCKTTEGEVPSQTINDVATVLKGASRGAAAIAIENKPENAKYVKLAVLVLDQFIIGDDYTPGALVDALKPIIKEVQDTKVSLAVSTIADLYEIAWGHYVKDKIHGSITATTLIMAIKEGAEQGLTAGDPAP